MAPLPCFRISSSSCFIQVQEGFGRFIGHVAHRAKDAGIVVSHAEPPEGGNRALDQPGGLRLVRDIADNTDGPMSPSLSVR